LINDQQKNIFKISSSKFGHIKKLFSSLHPQIKDMLRLQSHIERINWFSPKGDYTNSGACRAAE
jgi:hypothetical protein